MELAFEDALDIFRGWRDDTSQVAFFLDGTEALVCPPTADASSLS